jgi:hypothetical protein
MSRGHISDIYHEEDCTFQLTSIDIFYEVGELSVDECGMVSPFLNAFWFLGNGAKSRE